MKVLLIVPAYNEQDSITDTINCLESYKSKVSYQLDYIIINDGSTDKTKDILKKERLSHINLLMNLGIGGAVQTGFKFALKNNYDIAVQFDGDGQHDINSLDNLLMPIIHNQADMVVGSRFIIPKNSKFQTSFMRRLGNKIISFCIKLVTGKKIYDTTSGFRAINFKIIKLFAARYPSKYPEPESIVYAIKKRMRVQECTVNMFEREAGESSITPIKSVRYMLEVCSAILINGLMKEGD